MKTNKNFGILIAWEVQNMRVLVRHHILWVVLAITQYGFIGRRGIVFDNALMINTTMHCQRQIE